MIGDAERHVFVLDDEPEVREVIRRVLERAGIEVSCFGDPAVCLAKLRSSTCQLLITDLKMPTMDGMELLEEVKRIAPWVPVLVISGYGDIPTAVRAIRAGAVDFIEKPLNKLKFVQTVKSLLPGGAFSDPYLGKPLTPAETNILGLVLDGKSSKEIAKELHRSTRTIEGHRSNLMRKLNAENMLDLMKRVVSLGLINKTTKWELARVAGTMSKSG
ncbi:MAG: response regulator [Sedimentisphaerales bacterium]|jgi:two-component system response regulator FixJ